MRTIFFFAIVFLSVKAFSQCNYYYLQNNKKVTMAIFNNKGKESNRVIYTMSNVKKNGSVTTGNVTSEVIDKKGSSIGKANSTMQCKNGTLMMDMKMMLSPQQSAQAGDIQANASASYMEYPQNMKVGDDLHDGSFSMDIKVSGMPGAVSMDITNRHVTGKEKVTTPAGSWEAFKITYHVKSVMKMGFAIPMNYDITEWFAPDFGVVQSESKYGQTQLISIE